MDRPVVTLLTDFGTADGYVAAMRGVLCRLCPEARQVTISHEIPPQDVWRGAWVLATAAPWFPPGTVHLAVVDPGVGTDRRPIVVRAGGQTCVGPDNGLFTHVLDGDPDAAVHVIARRDLGPRRIAPTFHGRDLFAPAAAHLVRGLAPGDLGPRIDDPVRLPVEPPRVTGDALELTVLDVDRFGNVTTNLARHALVPPRAGLEPRVGLPGRPPGPLALTYAEAEPGATVVLWGSSDRLEIARNRDSAAAALGLAPGDRIRLALRWEQPAG
ncbi:MAG: hypothetical protein Kow0062_21420 [Acidobacteriota bacterium]